MTIFHWNQLCGTSRHKRGVCVNDTEICETLSNNWKADSSNPLKVKNEKALSLAFILVDRFTVMQSEETYVVWGFCGNKWMAACSIRNCNGLRKVCNKVNSPVNDSDCKHLVVYNINVITNRHARASCVWMKISVLQCNVICFHSFVGNFMC